MKAILFPSAALLFGVCCFATNFAAAQGTSFTYQGLLKENGSPATGTYDLRFTVYDLATGNGIGAGPLTNAPTSIDNGVFTVALDFGAGVFSGSARWLQIDVRTNGSAGAYTPLDPRQQLTPTPYSITAGNVTGPING